MRPRSACAGTTSCPSSCSTCSKRAISPAPSGVRRSAQWSAPDRDRKSTRLNSSHLGMSYAVFCLKKKNGLFTAMLVVTLAEAESQRRILRRSIEQQREQEARVAGEPAAARDRKRKQLKHRQSGLC